MQNKLKLLFIPYTFSNGGGAEKILQMLVNNLPVEKYCVSIQEVENFGKKLEINDEIRIKQSFWGQSLFDKFFYSTNYFLLVYFPKLLKKIFLLDNYDVVITYNYQLPSFMLPAFTHEKKIAWFHGDLYDLDEPLKKWERQKQHSSWKNTDKIVTISNKSQKSLIDIFPDFSEKSLIIHNGIDLKSLYDKSNETIDLQFAKENSIVCVGRLDENKNFLLVLKAVSILKKEGLNCNIIFVGEGSQKDLLQNEANALYLSDNIFFAGFQTNPYKYISRSKILCVSSLSEGWPTVVMEAMALGIPFVTTPVAGASDELADNGRCGLVAGYDEKEYAKAVKKLLIDEKLYQQMSENCKEKVKQYSAEKYAENFMKLLDEIGVNEINKNKHRHYPLIKTFVFYILYFILFLLSIGEIVFRFQIIIKRMKEKRVIKILKNIIYLCGLIVSWPLIFLVKFFIFPCYTLKIIKQNGGRKCK